ncbi:MAG: serine hydrolase [Candidatus Heimdallarchaeota archaeon]|nr:serine hydrolase [Candidatus Heimdallarchaeota archaeon]
MNIEEAFDKVEMLITNLMQQSRIPGLSLSVIKGKKVIYSKGFGARNLEQNLPATPETLFGIGSCTKSFTCLGIMQLAEQDKLSIEDPVSEYIPFKLGMKDHPIQIKHLMSHSSGVPNLGIAEVLIQRFSGIKETYVPLSDPEDIYLHINNAQKEVVDKPEQRFFYFNGGYWLLGQIIEKVTKKSYEQYIVENILKPLKMKRSTFLQESFEKDKDAMIAYWMADDKQKPSTHPFDLGVHAAGGLLSSVKELENYVQLYLNGGTLNDDQLISEKSIEKMFEGLLKFPQEGFFGKDAYGFGWLITEDFFGHKLVNHGGSTGMSSANISLIPGEKLGVVTAANCGNGQGSIISQIILMALLGKNPEKDHPVIVSENKHKPLIGEYATFKGINKISIKKKNGILYAINEEQKIDFPLIPESNEPDDFTFFVPLIGGRKLPVEFILNSSGKVDLLVDRNYFHKIS